ncbi:hypothetical protein [Streptomyces vinaceus]|uniref:hypothetical protein n=1 Tax=Streptomyces vinaceus TaxID=1960 RepID=UPI0036BDAF48
MTHVPITPNQIIPPGAPLPAQPGAQQPASNGYVDVHVSLTWDVPEPARPAWWRRIRWGYNAGCLLCGSMLAAPWAYVLAAVRDSQGLAGAWTIAIVPLAILTLLDNARRVEAAAAHPDLWAPKLRAARARILLDAALIATATTLPVSTIVYLITGVRP